MATEAEAKRLETRPRSPLGRRRQTDGIKSAAIWLLFVGILSLSLWYLTDDDSIMSMLLALTAISTIVLAVLVYFLSPFRPMRRDISDAMILSGTLDISNVLSSLKIRSNGVYIPISKTGTVKVYIPVPDDHIKNMLESMNDASNKTVFLQDDSNVYVFLSPPGHCLFLYAKQNGAQFSESNLEGEICNVMENSLELADKVEAQVNDGKVMVSMKNLVNNELCNAIRKEDPTICYMTGCPVCSAIWCMIANGTGKMVSMESIHVVKNTLNVEFRMIDDKIIDAVP